MTLTREHIVTSVHNHLELPKNRSAEAVDLVLKIIKETLASGEDVLISGFGKFCVRDKKKRSGRNPQTGAPPHSPPDPHVFEQNLGG